MPIISRCFFRRLFLAGNLFLGLALTAHADQAIQIAPLTPGEVWHRAEFRIEHAPTTENNFDPDLIRLDATVTSPSGQVSSVPGFWFQDFTRAEVNGAEVVTPKGAGEWRLRFTPTENGDYTISLAVTLGGAAPAGLPAINHFHVLSLNHSPSQSWVQKSPDARTFQTADGHPLPLVGENVCWGEGHGTYDFDTWFGAMKDSRQNFARIWLSPWSLALEHKPGQLNHYSLSDAWKLDHVFTEAERDGIYLLLSLDHHGMYQEENPNWGSGNNYWKTNPYNKLEGGPCVRPNDFFTSEQAKAVYQKRLRYLIGRYGYSPALLAWEFFNEIDNVYQPEESLVATDVAAWHQVMGQWLHAHDPFHHLVSTSLTGGSDRPEIWSLPEMDFAMYHSYGDPAPAGLLATLSQDFFQRYHKPVLIGEFGVSAAEWDLKDDPHLRGFRQLLWGGALGGSVGTSMSWWWDSLHREHVYPLYNALSEILGCAGWAEGVWTPIVFPGENAPPAALGQPLLNEGTFTAHLALSSYRRVPISEEVALANPLAAERAAENVSGFLLGSKAGARQRPIRLTAIFAPAAKLTFKVNAVAADVELVVLIDGTEALRTRIFDRDGLQSVNHEIDREFSVDLPTGRHVIQIVNTSLDWACLENITLHEVQTAEFAGNWKFGPQAIGLRNDAEKRAVLYLCSPFIVYPAGAVRYQPPLQEHQSVTLPNWPKGQFILHWFNPETGTELSQSETHASNGTLTVELPAFREDLAVVIAPVTSKAQ